MNRIVCGKFYPVILTVFIAIPFFVLCNSVQAVNLGESLSFNTSDKFDFSGRSSITATLRVVGQKAQYFFEDAYWSTKTAYEQGVILEKANKLSTEFDSRIYPLETSFWGSEPNPGIDSDPRIYIVLSNLVDTAGGYYDTGNQYRRDRVSESNEKEVIFLNIRTLLNSSERRANTFLSHEFQHLISFNQKTILRGSDEDVWLNEVRSEFTPAYLGYDDPYEGSNLKRRAAAFLADPSDSLTEWSNEAKDYGQVTLFGAYLVEHFGSSILSEALRYSESGIVSVEKSLKASNFSFSFSDLFLNWSVANAINDLSLNSLYGYFKEGLRQEVRVPPTQIIFNVNSQTDTFVSHEFKDWQAKWFWISNLQPASENTLRINFSGPKISFFKIAAIVFYQSGNKDVKFFDLSGSSNSTGVFFDLASGVEKIILIPVKMEKISDFAAQEELSSLHMSLKRVAVTPQIQPSPTPIPTPTPSAIPTPLPVIIDAKPSDFGLKEGDFIRAEGDNDIYIINDFGYKRLVLSPKICLQYGHLGVRGCFGAVKIVSPSVRDAFKTSWYFTNGETGDGKVYFLEQTGEDDAVLHHLNISGNDFKNQGGNFKSVFLFNSREQNSYFVGGALIKIPD